nr:PREDICTED: transcription factor MYB1R1-like [Raphanus sativus]
MKQKCNLTSKLQVRHAHENSSLPETNISSIHQLMQVNAQHTYHSNDASSNLVPVTFQVNPALNLNRDAAIIPSPLTLNLSLSYNLNEQSNSRHSTFKIESFTMMPSFIDGDSNSSIIKVA